MSESSLLQKIKNLSYKNLVAYYYQNKKKATNIAIAIVVGIGAIVGYFFYYLPNQEKEAGSELFYAHLLFERDSFKMAFNGGVSVPSPEGMHVSMGLKEIADVYIGTKAAKLANYYAGICLLNMAQYDEAIQCFENYNGSDAVLSVLSKGLIGDAIMEQNKYEEAAKKYTETANATNNEVLNLTYLKKAGLAYEYAANYKEAMAVYETIKTKYPNKTENDKYLARVKAKML